MTQEEKSLLLIDLCSRLPYGVIIQVKDWTSLDTELKIGHIQRLQNNDIELKPYLRPLYSMTDEERKEYKHFIAFSGSPGGAAMLIRWLNINHFDYLNLLEKGLAIEVTEENNPYED